MDASKIELMELLMPPLLDPVKRVKQIMRKATTQREIYELAMADPELINYLVLRAVTGALTDLHR